MKQKVLYLFVLLAAILVGGGRKLEAQIMEPMDAHIPFQFHAGGAEFAAGEYSIRSTSEDNDGALEIQSADGKKSALLETEPGDINSSQKNTELIFNQVGNDYYLSEVVDPDDAASAEVLEPDYPGKSEAAKNTTGKKHVFAFLHGH